MKCEYRWTTNTGLFFFSIDNDNFINATEIILLNGFIKKSSINYDKQIAIAQKLMEDFYD